MGIDTSAVWARFKELSADARPKVTQEPRHFGPMSEAAVVLPFPTDRADAAAARLALASVLAIEKTPLDVHRCGVHMRRTVATLKSLRPREGSPAPVKAVEELRRACAACGRCAGI